MEGQGVVNTREALPKLLNNIFESIASIPLYNSPAEQNKHSKVESTLLKRKYVDAGFSAFCV